MYILHGTRLSNLLPILHDKKLKGKGKHKKTMLIHSPTDQIFTQIIYKGIPYEADQDPFWYDICFVLDTRLLKDFPFYGDTLGSFAPSFKEGIQDPTYLVHGKGGYQRLPSFIKLKKLINETFKKRPWLKELAFSHSHEILFGNDIPLKKYCLGIVIDPSYKISRSVKKMIDQLGIPIIHIDRHEKGLDNFIDEMKKRL